MGLRDVLQQAVVTAISAIGDLSTEIIYINKSGETYDPSVGTPVANDTSYTGIMAAVVGFKSDEIDGSIVQKNDQKCLFSALDIPITPKVQDIITISGAEWNIERVLSPISGVINILHIREA